MMGCGLLLTRFLLSIRIFKKIKRPDDTKSPGRLFFEMDIEDRPHACPYGVWGWVD